MWRQRQETLGLLRACTVGRWLLVLVASLFIPPAPAPAPIFKNKFVTTFLSVTVLFFFFNYCLLFCFCFFPSLPPFQASTFHHQRYLAQPRNKTYEWSRLQSPRTQVITSTGHQTWMTLGIRGWWWWGVLSLWWMLGRGRPFWPFNCG